MYSSDSSPSSSSSSSSSSSRHPASLVSEDMHSPALMELIDVQITNPIIHYVVEQTAETVDYALGRPHHRGRSVSRRPELAKFTTFVTNVLTRAEVTTPVILATLAYIDRAKPHLQFALEEWALERVFLGAIIVASKYTCDSTLKNVHWALCTGVFGKRDVGRIEREFLDVLDWELSLSEADVLSHHSGIFAVIAPSSPPSHSQSHHSHELPRHHSRTHHRTSCPELEPSSPLSSDGSISPQTPSTLNNSPESLMPTKGTKDAVASSGIRELIQSFPIPSHPSNFPIQV